MNIEAYAAYRKYRKQVMKEALFDADNNAPVALCFAEKSITPYVYFEKEFILNKNKVK